MLIHQVTDKETKKNIVRYILEALPDWFAIPEAREEYIKDGVEQICRVYNLNVLLQVYCEIGNGMIKLLNTQSCDYYRYYFSKGVDVRMKYLIKHYMRGIVA